jgi:uncharacterized protein YggE
VAGIILVVSLAVAGLAGCSSSSPAGVSGIFSNQQQGIWVNGEGKVTVTPDVVNINLGIQSQEATVAEAQAKAVQAMDQVMNVLKTNGIADKDIQTQQYNISPVYQYDDVNKKNNIIGYQVTNTVNVKVRDTTKAGPIIDAVTAAGGDLTRIDSISFSVDDPTQYYGEARQKAMADAENKAKQLASLSGVTLGKPTYITESTYTPGPVYAKDTASAGAGSSTSISTGSTDITLNVQVTYSILK